MTYIELVNLPGMKKILLSLMLFFFAQISFSQKTKNKKQTKKEELIFEKVELENGFPGGEIEWQKFVSKNFNADAILERMPDPTREYEDSLYLQFIINTTGAIEQIKFNSNASNSFKDEVSRVVLLQPKWLPLHKGGRYLKAYRCYLFTFRMLADQGWIIVKKLSGNECKENIQ